MARELGNQGVDAGLQIRHQLTQFRPLQQAQGWCLFGFPWAMGRQVSNSRIRLQETFLDSLPGFWEVGEHGL